MNNPVQTPLIFSYWKFDAGGDDAPERRRHIVNEIIVPIFGDLGIRRDAVCIYARKYTAEKPEDVMTPSLEPSDEVRLYIATAVTDRPRIAQSVSQHVNSGIQVTGPLDYHAKDRACLPDCEWYRRGLTDVAGIALDLHNSPLLEAHRERLRGLYRQGGLRALTHANLNTYLREHAPHYPRTDDGQTTFWRDFLRWGPAPNLFPPGHLLVNLLLIV